MPATKPTTFPDNIVWDLDVYFDTNLAGADSILKRPVRPTDASRTIGIVAEDWEPPPNAYEMGQDGPLLGKYMISVWAIVKHALEEEGIREHGILARNIRRMMASDATLLGTLRTNVDDYGTGVERAQRVRVMGQEFLSNEVNKNQLFLSITRLMIETEST